MNESITVALIGLVGALVGAGATLGGQFLVHCLKARAEAKKDEPRRKLLKTMLEDERYSWRKLDTLMHVVGSDAETTKRLLLDLGARASEDGQELWSLISRNPLNKQ